MTELKIGEGIRQGDVYIFRIEDGELPHAETCKAVKGQHVLAYGEATGHQHSFSEDDCELYSANDNLCKIAKKYGVIENLAVTHVTQMTIVHI